MKYLMIIIGLSSCESVKNQHIFNVDDCICPDYQEFADTNIYNVRKVTKVGELRYQLKNVTGYEEERPIWTTDGSSHKVECPKELQ